MSFVSSYASTHFPLGIYTYLKTTHFKEKFPFYFRADLNLVSLIYHRKVSWPTGNYAKILRHHWIYTRIVQIFNTAFIIYESPEIYLNRRTLLVCCEILNKSLNSVLQFSHLLNWGGILSLPHKVICWKITQSQCYLTTRHKCCKGTWCVSGCVVVRVESRRKKFNNFTLDKPQFKIYYLSYCHD